LDDSPRNITVQASIIAWYGRCAVSFLGQVNGILDDTNPTPHIPPPQRSRMQLDRNTGQQPPLPHVIQPIRQATRSLVRAGVSWPLLLHDRISHDLIKINETNGGSMQTMTANQAKTQFGAFIDMAQKEPVRVMRHDRVVGVLVSASDYEAMRAFYADRLARTLDATAAHAAATGLTQEQLQSLLADES
jgi:PHD/YefM family antitoxin component YafN of YafNO toxin-antitoxin module